MIRVNDFSTMVFSDESTIQLDCHSHIVFRKKNQRSSLKQCAKHPAKLHVWAAISPKGASKIVMFNGILDADRLSRIYENALVPFVHQNFPGGIEGHRFQQDNDPKHTSHRISNFLKDNNINWWAFPPESPDLNPIENVLGSMKQYLRNVCKPRNLEELKRDIRQFWSTMTPAVCRKYISHLRKVIPEVVRVNGEPSGY